MPPVVVDTSALLAFFDASEPDHDAVLAVLATADALVVSPYVVAELDYLVATGPGVDDELTVLDELAGGAWDLAAFDDGGLRRARAIVDSDRDQAIGVADASIVVLAERYRTRTIATLDRRHLDVLRLLDGGCTVRWRRDRQVPRHHVLRCAAPCACTGRRLLRARALGGIHSSGVAG